MTTTCPRCPTLEAQLAEARAEARSALDFMKGEAVHLRAERDTARAEANGYAQADAAHRRELEVARNNYAAVYDLLKAFDVYGTGGDASSCAREALMQLSEALNDANTIKAERDALRGELERLRAGPCCPTCADPLAANAAIRSALRDAETANDNCQRRIVETEAARDRAEARAVRLREHILKDVPCGRISNDSLHCMLGRNHAGHHSTWGNGPTVMWPESEAVGWVGLPSILTATDAECAAWKAKVAAEAILPWQRAVLAEAAEHHQEANLPETVRVEQVAGAFADARAEARAKALERIEALTLLVMDEHDEETTGSVALDNLINAVIADARAARDAHEATPSATPERGGGA